MFVDIRILNLTCNLRCACSLVQFQSLIQVFLQILNRTFLILKVLLSNSLFFIILGTSLWIRVVEGFRIYFAMRRGYWFIFYLSKIISHVLNLLPVIVNSIFVFHLRTKWPFVCLPLSLIPALSPRLLNSILLQHILSLLIIHEPFYLFLWAASIIFQSLVVSIISILIHFFTLSFHPT